MYSQRNASIAIQTTCHRFSRSLEENYEGRVYIGKVENIDYDKEWMNEWKTYEAFVIKGKSFEHEQEVRAVTLLPKPDSLEPVLGKEAILREQVNIEIIIIGAKGRSGIKKLLVGSVTLAVINHADCQVTVVSEVGFSFPSTFVSYYKILY